MLPPSRGRDRGEDTPYLNPLLRTPVRSSWRLRRFGTPHLNPLPQGERKRNPRSPRLPPSPELWRTSRRDKTPLYVSAKRTHFIFRDLFMYRGYLQQLVIFAEAFANGFVREKR